MLLSECDQGLLLHHDQLHVKDEGGVGGDGTLPARSIPLIVFNCKIQPGQDYIKLKNFIVSHPMSEEMVSLALCPFDILAMPSSHPAITSFLPDITKYQTLMFSGVARAERFLSRYIAKAIYCIVWKHQKISRYHRISRYFYGIFLR